MGQQLFRKTIPNKIIFDLLEKICMKTERYYLFDINAYKKLLYYKYHEPFLTKVADAYQTSKRFYAERELSYKSFTNILRQISKNNGIMFTTQIRYSESKYNIIFLFYFQ